MKRSYWPKAKLWTPRSSQWGMGPKYEKNEVVLIGITSSQTLVVFTRVNIYC